MAIGSQRCITTSDHCSFLQFQEATGVKNAPRNSLINGEVSGNDRFGIVHSHRQAATTKRQKTYLDWNQQRQG
jgi:hypothetical protein